MPDYKERGVVKWFSDDKGYGFIRADSGEERFVHFTGIVGKRGERKSLERGEEVEYYLEESKSKPGKYAAVDVVRL